MIDDLLWQMLKQGLDKEVKALRRRVDSAAYGYYTLSRTPLPPAWAAMGRVPMLGMRIAPILYCPAIGGDYWVPRWMAESHPEIYRIRHES